MKNKYNLQHWQLDVVSPISKKIKIEKNSNLSEVRYFHYDSEILIESTDSETEENSCQSEVRSFSVDVESQYAFFKPPILLTPPISPIINNPSQEELDLKNKAIHEFLTTLKSISERVDTLILSKILSALSYYYLKLIELPKQFSSSQWISAKSLNEQAINFDPTNAFAKRLRKHNFENKTSVQSTNSKSQGVRAGPSYARFLFNQSLEDFIMELDVIYNCAPLKIIPTLFKLAEKLRPGLLSLETTEDLETMINELQSLQPSNSAKIGII
ncbi:MAG: hypothetical protein H0U73_08315 [Tatlockia sp.]|nr:hypothetical protein [Tatlockia sp.]